MKKFTKEYFLRVFLLLLGLTIAHLGVTLFLLSDLGADPFNVMVQGIFRTLSKVTGWEMLTHGRVHIVICCLIILVLLFVDKSYIKIGTILCMACGGPIIDFFNFLLSGILKGHGILFRFFMLAAGCVILAFGMTIVIKSEAGTGPNDLVALVISEKGKIRFFIVRMVVDGLFALCGFLLGGVIGIGTIVCAFLVGPVADFFLIRNEKWIQALVAKYGR